MSTGNQNLDLLIKLLNLTSSNLDSEALAAMRKANEQLGKFNTTWEKLLKSRVTIVADPFGPTSQPQFQSKTAPPADIPRPQPRPATTPPRPQPQAPQSYFIILPRGEQVGPFLTHTDASAYRSRLNISGNINQMAPPRVFENPYQYEKHLQRRRQPAAPQPTASVSQPMPTGRTNKFASKCYTCSRRVGVNEGILSHQNSAGQWMVTCGPNFGHNAKYAARAPRPAANVDDLKDLLF